MADERSARDEAHVTAAALKVELDAERTGQARLEFRVLGSADCALEASALKGSVRWLDPAAALTRGELSGAAVVRKRASSENQTQAAVITDLREQFADSEAEDSGQHIEIDSMRDQLEQAHTDLSSCAAVAWYVDDEAGSEGDGFHMVEPGRSADGAAQRAPPPPPFKVRNSVVQEGGLSSEASGQSGNTAQDIFADATGGERGRKPARDGVGGSCTQCASFWSGFGSAWGAGARPTGRRGK